VYYTALYLSYALSDNYDIGFRYKRDAVKKLKMSNGGAADDVSLSSRCIRNNDKTVDNNVLFTGRLPVSTGSQHHQWQQQQQQLLVLTDDANETLFTSHPMA